MTGTQSDDLEKLSDIEKDALKHSWDWFSMHAAQRMQSFNFFLVATAFLAAGYSALLDKQPIAAIAVALLGSIISNLFSRLDLRTRQLIVAGEDVLKELQLKIAKGTGIAEVEILKKVDKKTCGSMSYRKVIGGVQHLFCGVFLIAALFAAYLTLMR